MRFMFQCSDKGLSGPQRNTILKDPGEIAWARAEQTEMKCRLSHCQQCYDIRWHVVYPKRKHCCGKDKDFCKKEMPLYLHPNNRQTGSPAYPKRPRPITSLRLVEELDHHNIFPRITHQTSQTTHPSSGQTRSSPRVTQAVDPSGSPYMRKDYWRKE